MGTAGHGATFGVAILCLLLTSDPTRSVPAGSWPANRTRPGAPRICLLPIFVKRFSVAIEAGLGAAPSSPQTGEQGGTPVCRLLIVDSAHFFFRLDASFFAW